MSFEPRTRLQKILMGIAATPRTALEHAVKYAVDHSGGGGSGSEPYATTGTFGESESKDTITLNKTASELYAAISGGALCKITATFVVQESTLTKTAIVSISSSKLSSGENDVEYSFSFVDTDGVIFKTEDLTADDAVVFEEI